MQDPVKLTSINSRNRETSHTSTSKTFKEITQEEHTTLMESRGCVYSSLGRFSTHLMDKTKTTHLLLDSCDTVYNAIAQIGPEGVAICKSFTKFLKCAVPIGTTGVNMFRRFALFCIRILW